MGASQSEIYNDDLFTEFKREDWRRELDLGLCQLWENTQTGELCEAYKLDYVPQEQELQHYRFRHYNQNADNFVEIRYVDVQKKQTLCYHGESYVLTEFIPVKLSDMDGLTFPQACAILKSAFRAFHTMQAFHGPFIPNEQLIGINLSGRPKIWLNKNHSKNRADKQIKAEIWQKHMGEVSENVKRIVQIMQQKLKQRRFPGEFRDYFNQQVINFAQASQYVQEYCQKYHLSIPQRVQYLRFLDDRQVMRVVNEYLVKHGQNDNEAIVVRNDDINGENNFITREENNINNGVRILSRNGSQQNVIAFHHPPQMNGNTQQQLNQQQQNQQSQSHYMPTKIVAISPTTAAVVPVPGSFSSKKIIGPSIISAGPALVIRRQQRKLSTNKIVFVQPPLKTVPASTIIARQSSNKIIQILPSSTTLNTTTNFIPSQQPKPQVRKVIINPNTLITQTPRHMNPTNHVTFIPPNKITQYQRPIRTEVSQVKQVLLPQQIPYMRTKQQQQSIHEKMREFVNENSQQQQQQQYHQQQVANHESHLIVQNDNRYQPSQFEQKYISNNINDIYGKEQYVSSQQQQQHPQHYAQSLHEDDNLTSQPDWQAIRRHQQQQKYQQQQQQQQQHQYQHNQQQQYNQHYDFEIKHQHIMNENDHDMMYEKQYLTQQKVDQNNNGNEISPIKSSGEKNVTQFQRHYHMFAKYAGGDGNGRAEQFNHDRYNQEDRAHNNTQVMNSFQTAHNQLNESQNVSSNQQNPQQQQQQYQQQYQQQQQKYQQPITQQQSNHPYPHPNSPTHSPTHPYPTSLIQSQQRLRQLSSKNTSINRGTRQQSSGTMVIHESKQNIYQGVLQQKFDNIFIKGNGDNIQQQRQYQGQDNYAESVQQQQQPSQRQQQQYQQNNNRFNEQYQQQQQQQQQIQKANRIMQQAVKEMEQQRLKQLEQQQKEYLQQQQREYVEFQKMRYNNGNNVIDVDDRNEQREQYQQQQQQQQQHPQHSKANSRIININNNNININSQYDNLHFRNQSQQLYQYTPVEPLHKSRKQSNANVENINTNINIDNTNVNINTNIAPTTSPTTTPPVHHGFNYNYHPVPRPHYPSGVQQITQIQSHQDIQNYIRKKYSSLIGHTTSPVMTQSNKRLQKQQKQQHQQQQQQKQYQHQQQHQQQHLQQHQQQQPITRKRSTKDYNTRAMTFAKPIERQEQQQQHNNEQQQGVKTNEYQDDDNEQQQQYMNTGYNTNNNNVIRVQSQYEQFNPKDDNYLNVEAGDGDFLDVGNLEKSLDRKYNTKHNAKDDTKSYRYQQHHQQQQSQNNLQSPKPTHAIRSSQMSQQDGMNIAALDQRLQKFQQRQSIQREKSQRKLQTYTEELSGRNNNLNASVNNNNNNNNNNNITNSSSNELNFNQLDNIVELMDRKIQQSQKKQQKQSMSNNNNSSDYSLKYQHLDNIQLQTSINDKDLSLKNIPILGKEEISIASGSKPPSKRDYVKNYGFDSEDFATGREYSTYEYQPISRNQSYKTNKRSSQNHGYAFENEYNVLSPVAQMEKKFQSYSSRNYQNINTQALPKFTIDSGRQKNDYSRKSSRRSTRNNEDAKRIADKISDKYDKYMNESSASSGKPFAKKSYYESGASYESSSRNQSSAYAEYTSKYNTKDTGSYPSNKQLQRKRSSYLNPIQQLNVEHNPSPYRQQVSPKNIGNLQFANPIQSNRENISKVSNSSSRIGSKTNIAGGDKPGKSSRVSYDELRDLLWK